MSQILLISDAAKEVKVESHVLRYWEEELHLPIKRNELGHRYYTKEDVERFKQIKSMKERGLQLKAIKMILKDGKLNILPQESEPAEEPVMAIDIVNARELENNEVDNEIKEDKAKRLQWMLQQLIRQAIQENNQELCREMKESIIKELDYQFRVQDEAIAERNEAYYQKMDELIRRKSKRIFGGTASKKKEKGLPH